MLRTTKGEVKRLYYDPAFRGIDLEAHFKAGEERMKSAGTEIRALAIVVETLMRFGDSHTYLIPPARAYDLDYGFEMRMIGDTCRVVEVVPGSDAAQQGLRKGAEVLALEGLPVTRRSFPTLSYALNVALPRRSLHVKYQLEPGGATRDQTIAAKIDPRKRELGLLEWFEEEIDRAKKSHVYPVQLRTLDEGVSVARVLTFSIAEETLDNFSKRLAGRRALVLDLRGNGGGSEEILRGLAGIFFEKETDIATLKGRKQPRTLRTKKPGGKRFFGGEVVVMVDSSSGSASEVLARFLQLEGRARVVGDRSAGGVMRSEQISLTFGTPMHLTIYGLSVTTDDLAMKDGVGLEGRGVTPDETVLPSGEDLRRGRDPALARAAAMLGVKMPSEYAGLLFAKREAKSDDRAAKKDDER